MSQLFIVYPQQFSATLVIMSIRLDSVAMRILLGSRNPRAPTVALLFFLFSDRLDERADAAENGVYPSTLILEYSHHMCVTATTSLNFATVEHSEREAAIPAQTSVGTVASKINFKIAHAYCGNSVANMNPAPHGKFGRTSLMSKYQKYKNNEHAA
jgi:hypothetical protein